MKKAIIITLAIFLFAFGGYYLYEKYANFQDTSQWDLIPESAVLVYESKDLVRVWNHLNDQPLWKSMAELPGLNTIAQSVLLVDSISGREGSLDEILKKQAFLTSLHITSRDEFGFIFYVKLNNTGNLQTVQEVLKHFESSPGIKSNVHTYDQFNITELKNAEGEIFSYFFFKDFFVFSYTPILIEDVVRNLSNKTDGDFKKNVESLFKIVKLENDEGNVYIDMDKMYLLLSIFYKSTPEELKDLVHFSDASFLDLKVLPNSLLLNGFTLTDPLDQEYLSIYKNQKPGTRTIENMVSNRTALLFHYYLDDPAQWTSDLYSYWEAHDKERIRALMEFGTQYNYDPRELMDWLGQELALLYMEPIGNSPAEKLIMLKTNDITEARNSLDRFAESLSTLVEDSVYLEIYGQYSIGQLYVNQLPSTLFGSLFQGFEQCFYTFHDNYVILGTSIQTLKTQINDLESENVWGKSIKINQFLDDHTLEESNLSLIINTTRSWPITMSLLNDKWKEFFQSQDKNLKQLELISLQYSNIEEKFYTNLSIKHRAASIAEPTLKRFRSVQYTKLNGRILTKPFVVRNHRDDSREVILQDSSLAVNLISRNGDLQWDLPVDEKIVSDIKQIDYYNNGKLQYFFATEKSIYIIDRNGKNIENFPIRTNKRIRTANIIDYDNSKNYRIAIADDSGLQYLYNKEGQLLKGWDPLSVSGIQNLPLRHIRVRKKDCMIIEKEDGTIHVMNRRGQYYSGFPLKLDTRLISPLYIEVGSGFSSTRLTTITEAGELITFNLNGDIIEKNQLIKPSEETQFSIVVDGLKKSFIIARQELNRLTLLDRNGKEMFEKSFSTSNNLTVQYYNFNSDTEIIAVNDKVQEFTFVYDGEGNLYNEVPAESSHDIGLMYFENQDLFNMYVNFEDKTSILSFKKGN